MCSPPVLLACWGVRLSLVYRREFLMEVTPGDSGSCFCPNSACLLVSTAIILFGEPIRWETNLQLLIDVLLTDGNPASVYDHQLPVQLPVLSCNMDLVWMAEAPSPRYPAL